MMGKFWQKAGDVVGAIFGSNGDGKSVIGELSDVADRFIETKADKKEFQLKAEEIMHRREVQAREAEARQREEFNKRIKDLEGTASDLNQAGWPGRVVLFFRGLQRPLWGFLTLFIDIQVFSQAWKITEGSLQETAFLAVNILVLGFLFGERAVKNVMPFISQYLEKRKQ